MANMLKLSKAFSDKNRVKILDMLTDGPKNVSSVADKLNVEENLASHHLRVLHSLGLLKNSKKGRQVFYDLNKVKLVTLLKDLKKNEFFREVLTEALEEK
jgi:ArsR family transcriptional regulator